MKRSQQWEHTTERDCSSFTGSFLIELLSSVIFFLTAATLSCLKSKGVLTGRIDCWNSAVSSARVAIVCNELTLDGTFDVVGVLEYAEPPTQDARHHQPQSQLFNNQTTNQSKDPCKLSGPLHWVPLTDISTLQYTGHCKSHFQAGRPLCSSL
jgi:hypothetical protein